MSTPTNAPYLLTVPFKQDWHEGGFTLIELTVVMLIVTMLSAIALPSFLNQANKAKQTEAKTYTGAFIRAQQAYYLEQHAFAPTLELLSVSIPTQTVNYQYSAHGPYNVAAPNENMIILGQSLKTPLKSYVGMVQVGTMTGSSEVSTLAILCESNSPGLGSIPAPTAAANGPVCSSGTVPINK
ncbi:type IV pilin-like G/H family protein [Trichothermofontia sp.]